jgi:hypothetical protein
LIDERKWIVGATMDTGGSMDDDHPVDIDALARRLSSEAERLRRSESGKEASSSSSEPQSYAFSDPIFGPEVSPSLAARPSTFSHGRSDQRVHTIFKSGNLVLSLLNVPDKSKWQIHIISCVVSVQ